MKCFFFSSRRRHTRWNCDWSSDVCSSDLRNGFAAGVLVKFGSYASAYPRSTHRDAASMTHLLTENPHLHDFSSPTPRTCRSSHRQPPELLSEGIFQRILSWERKKAERSRKCVLLMLLDVERVLLKNPSNRVLSGI